MKRFKGLLSLMIAVVSVFMVGFTTVKADEIKLVSGKVFFDGAISPINGGKRDFHLKQVEGRNDAYAFCLDSQRFFYKGKYISNSGLNYDSKKIKNVVLKAYLAGLGTDKNVYGISNDELYEITQMAVWYASHGTGENGMLPGDTYINWINESGKEYRKNIYNYLINDNNVPTFTEEPSISNWKGTLKPDANKEYFVSSDFTINGSKDLVFTVSADKKTDVCVLYNGTCEKTQYVPAGASFKLRTKYVANEDVEADAYISVDKYLNGFSFNLYQPEVTQDNQNAAVFVPEFGKWNDYVVSTGRDDVKRKEPVTLKVSKTDITGQNEISGAKMRITDVNGKEIISWESGKVAKEISSEIINVGEMYLLYEDAAPAGYVAVHNAFGFVLNEDGRVSTCDLNKDNKKCIEMSKEDILKITNEATKLTVSKKSGAGQDELEGAHMQIKDLSGNIVTDINGAKLDWVSDGNTREIEGLVVGKIYKMIETSTKEGFDPLTVNIYFRLDENGKVQLCNVKNNDEKTAECSSSIEVKEDGTTYAEINGEILVIRNYPSKTPTKFVVSKKDGAGQGELEGAHMQIVDESGNIAVDINGAKLDWISDGNTRNIEGLIPGKIYRMIETTTKDGYDPLTVDIYFKLDEYGKVQLCNVKDNDISTAKCGSDIRVDKDGITYAEIDGEVLIIRNYPSMRVPNTGINSSKVYIIGGIVMLIGASIVVYARKKELF